jgi:hypothetical protein
MWKGLSTGEGYPAIIWSVGAVGGAGLGRGDGAESRTRPTENLEVVDKREAREPGRGGGNTGSRIMINRINTEALGCRSALKKWRGSGAVRRR